ncbi:MAG: aldo/keto reductase [Candidatus Rokubacteria bacterium]|nr:aldo/keto reductase [Candidatus Rokubacteria bacterium]
MEARATLGRTGLTVSTLCFGTGYMGGSVAAGARLLSRAYDLGVTFWDTSDDYGTHPHVARALREVGREGVVVATKTYASTALGVRRSINRALRELRVEAVDIFLLHAVDSAGELDAKLPALEALARAKAEGLVRAVGVSSHSREVLARLLTLPEVDVALVVVNRTGVWMKDASPAEMSAAIRRLYRSGRGVYGMKALGSGQVTGETEVAAALGHAFRYPCAHAICVGITTERELEADVAAWRRSLDRRSRRQPAS